MPGNIDPLSLVRHVRPVCGFTIYSRSCQHACARDLTYLLLCTGTGLDKHKCKGVTAAARPCHNWLTAEVSAQAIETTSGDWATVDARLKQAEADSALLADLLQKAAHTHQVSCWLALPLRDTACCLSHMHGHMHRATANALLQHEHLPEQPCGAAAAALH